MLQNAISVLSIAAIILLGSLVGGRYGEVLGRLGRVADGELISGYVERFEEVVEVLESRSADPIDRRDGVYEGAVPGMLAGLDPHSRFFSPQIFDRFKEEQQGSYAGVGMQIRSFRGRTIVDYPFPGTPAFHAGVRPGDEIQQVDGIPTDGFSVEEVAETVRGPRGTSVRLGLWRDGTERAVELDMVRDRIPRPTVPPAFMLSDGIGYLRIRSFGEKTAEELDQALSGLEERGLGGLVLDLRANHGGMLSAGVYATGRFLKSGSPVVSHRGRSSRERVYDANPGQTVSPYPMTVLVDCRSASAAEILAGALQDHDRALIVGSNTFGKGLVQSVYSLDDGAGMVLTTARYYTPSGRLIQRTYYGLDMRTYHADPCSPDFQAEQVEKKKTTAGRVVYGGGGITPDLKLPGPTETLLFRAMRESRAFERHAERVADELKPLPHKWELDEQTLAGFRRFVQSERLEIDDAEYQQSLPQIRRVLKAAIYTVAVDLDAGERVLAELDPDIRRAVELMPQAAALLRGGETD